jgi:hypothetical protein
LNYSSGYDVLLNCSKILLEIFIRGDYCLENYVLTVKKELVRYWASLCHYDLFIENTDSLVLRLNLFYGNIGSSEYLEYLGRIRAKFALCFNIIPPFVFIPEENLLKILSNGKETLDNILKNYKIILKHEYGHCLFYQELFDKYPNENELQREYEKINKSNNIYLEKHNNMQFITTYVARKHYYSSIPNELCANKLADVDLDELICAEEYLGKYYN